MPDRLSKPRWISPANLSTVGLSLVVVLAAAAFQHAVVLDRVLEPRLFVVPSLVGAGFGLLLVAFRRLLSLNRLYTSELTARQRTILELNQDLERRVIARTQEVAEKQEQLLRGQRLQALATLSGGIVHDLNNLLHIIVASAGDIEERSADQVVSESARQVMRSGEKASELTSRILTVGAVDRDSERRELSAVAAPVIDLLRHSFGREHRLTLEIVDGSGRVPVAAVEQIVLNLVVNARDAMKEGGEIRVILDTRSDEDGRRALIRVRDDGPGIPASIRDRVFEPFVTSKPPGEGTGLGLATVRSLVEAHQGVIELETSTDGTTFEVLLPCPPEEEASPDSAIAESR